MQLDDTADSKYFLQWKKNSERKLFTARIPATVYLILSLAIDIRT